MLETEKKTERKMLLICFMISFVVFICQIEKNGMMYLSTDEFGQWATAAWLAGSDWSPIASHNAYYSYFYAFPLSLLFRLFRSPIMMYQAATVMNAFLLGMIVYLAYFICGKLYNGKHTSTFYGLLALNCALFSSNIIMANLTWSESMLIFISWLVLYVVVTIFQDSIIKSRQLVFLSILLMAGYMTHQRFLGILISGVLVIGLSCVARKISKKQFVIFLVTMGILILFHKIMKTNIQTYVYMIQEGQTVGNDYSGQMNKLSYALSLEGLFTLVRIFIGQMYYMGTSTCFLSYLGIIFLVKRLKEVVYRKQWLYDGKFYLYLFVALSILSTVAISCIFLISGWRIDHILYGRYNEIVLGFLLLFGWLELREGVDFYKCFGVLMAGALIAFITQNSIDTLISSNAIQPICIGGIAMWWNMGLKIGDIYIVSAILFVLLIIFTRKMPPYFHRVTVSCLTVFFVVSGLSVNKTNVLPAKSAWQGLKEMVDSREQSLEGSRSWIWLDDGTLKQDEKPFSVNVTPPLLQFLLKDKTLHYLDESELETRDSSNAYIATKIFPFYLPEYQMINRKDEVYLLEKDSESGAQRNEIPLGWFSSQGVASDSYRSYGKEEALLYGPYANLRPGAYLFEIDLVLFEGSELLGKVDVVSEDTTLYEAEISQSDLIKNNYKICIPLVTSKSYPKFELRVMTALGTDIQIKKIHGTYEE